MKILLIGLGAASLIIIFREKGLRWIGDFLIIEDTLQPADVIHTIAGDDYRTDYAIQLYQQGYGKTLFFTGGWCQYHLYNHGQHAEERAIARGLSPEAIAFDESRVTSTYMEAQLLKDWITNNSYSVQSIIVVSDPFHMRRVGWTYRKVFGDQVQIQLAPVPMELTPYKREWWKDWGSRKYIREEYQKFLYYLLRYQFSGGAFREWLASLDTE